MSLKQSRILLSLSIIGICGILYFYVLHVQNYGKDVAPSSSQRPLKSKYPSNESAEHSSLLKDTIPRYAEATLNYILQNGKAPEGYVGGRIFSNREKRLVNYNASGQRISYQEWDVHPKSKLVHRGAERLITGSDGSAYFTSDHYKTFIKIR
ncbi:MAG: ribonuclease domain-containing protein [Saprospiraceae bacterium]